MKRKGQIGIISVMRNLFFVFLIIFTFNGLAYSQYLDPGSYASPGTFNPSSSVTVNMSTRSMSGGATATGVMSGDILVIYKN